jgi:cell division protein FtsW
MERRQADRVFFFIVLALLAIGLAAVTSASGPEALNDTGGSNVFHYSFRQFIFSLIGLLGGWGLSNFSHFKLKRYSLLLLILSLGLLILVLTPLGLRVNGAQRWFRIFSFTFQPSEMAKVAVIIFVAHYLAEIRKTVRSFRAGVGWPMLLLVIIMGLIMLEPDLGTSLVFAVTLTLMLIMGGARLWHLAPIIMIGLAGIIQLIRMEPYRLERFFTYLNIWHDPQGSGWQIINGLYALGNGGFFGQGLGFSRQKFHYLPEAHTDYIFAIIGEEMGLIGTLTIILLFTLLAWRGYQIALRARDPFSRMLAAGLTASLTFQAFLNIAVVTASVPTTGITLPFISSGGSSLIFSLLAAGILLNISKYNELLFKGEQETCASS